MKEVQVGRRDFKVQNSALAMKAQLYKTRTPASLGRVMWTLVYAAFPNSFVETLTPNETVFKDCVC